MPKRSKRYLAAKKQIENRLYSVTEAVTLIKKIGKPSESVEIHAKLGIDPKKGEQQVRGTLTLPHGSGKTKRIAAFVEGPAANEAKEAGADLIGLDDLIADILKTGKIDFDIAVATPASMPKLAKVAKVLGPKGLMPNPKTDTVSANVKKMIEELKRGKIAFKNDDTGNVHLLIGKLSLNETELSENISLALEALKRLRPSTSKGTFLMTVVLKSAMSPGIALSA